MLDRMKLVHDCTIPIVLPYIYGEELNVLLMRLTDYNGRMGTLSLQYPPFSLSTTVSGSGGMCHGRFSMIRRHISVNKKCVECVVK